jgi:hypothetical protein
MKPIPEKLHSVEAGIMIIQVNQAELTFHTVQLATAQKLCIAHQC